MTEVDALLFDLDGTLIDSQADLANSVRYLQTYYAHPVSSDADVASFIGDGVIKLVERALPELSDNALLEAVERFKQYYQDHCLERTVLCEGALEALQFFRGKKLGVVTNKPERISRRILRGLNVDNYFAIVVGGDTLSKKKPDPLPVLHALEKLGDVAASRAVLVGDSVNDIASGRAAGVITCDLDSTISHTQPEKSLKPHHKINSLHDLVRLFR